MTRTTLLATVSVTLAASLFAVTTFPVTAPLTGEAIAETSHTRVSANHYDLGHVEFTGAKVTRSSSALTLSQPSEDEWTEIVALVDSIEDTEWTTDLD